MIYRLGAKPTTHEQALTVTCPDCNAAPGNPCVYLWPKGVNPDGSHNAAQQARIDQVGTPTQVVHNGRRRAYTPPATREPATEVRVQLDVDSLRIIYAALNEAAERVEEPSALSLQRWIADQKIAPALWKLTGEWP